MEMELSEPYLEAWKEEEESILRACSYTLQGIDGDHRLQFSWTATAPPRGKHPSEHHRNHQGLVFNSPVLEENPTLLLPPQYASESRLGSGARDALARCAEMGWLYHRVQDYVDKIEGDQSAGSVCRAFGCALAQELHTYREFLSRIADEGAQTTTNNGQSTSPNQNASNPPRPLAHVRQLLLALLEPMQKLQTLATLTDSLRLYSGGPLLQALKDYARNGNSIVSLQVHQLLAAASHPWFQMLHMWVTEGVLVDTALEFFILSKADVQRSSRTYVDMFLWEDTYQIDWPKVPTGLIELELVTPIFRVGKGINFIRRCLMDQEWTLDEDLVQRAKHVFAYTVPKSLAEPNLSQSTTNKGIVPELHSIRSTLRESLCVVHSHILKSLREEHNLMLHLLALKQFLLLGQGDFFSALSDQISSEFSEQHGIQVIYKHTLAAVVESAIRSSNAHSFPPQILQCLEVDVRANSSESRGSKFRTVWDVFRLGYRVPEALRAIVHPVAQEKYRQVFEFLFELKAVEHLLNSTWRTSATLQHALQTVAQHNGMQISKDQSYATAIVLLRQISMTRQAMVHFVVNFKSYLMFEVLEGGWKELVYRVQEADTLDDVIAAHDSYLSTITRKGLLECRSSQCVPRTNNESELSCGTEGGLVGVSEHLRDLLRLCKDFCSYQQQLFGSALQAADRASEKRREAEQRVKKGDWGFDDENENFEEQDFFGLADISKVENLDALITNSFHDKMDELLACLVAILDGSNKSSSNQHTQPYGHDFEEDLDSIRFLAFQLNQNRFYAEELNGAI